MVEVECLLLRFITCNEFRHLKWLNKIDKNGEKMNFRYRKSYQFNCFQNYIKKISRNLKKMEQYGVTIWKNCYIPNVGQKKGSR